jgi:hypothetical protein
MHLVFDVLSDKTIKGLTCLLKIVIEREIKNYYILSYLYRGIDS